MQPTRSSPSTPHPRLPTRTYEKRISFSAKRGYPIRQPTRETTPPKKASGTWILQRLPEGSKTRTSSLETTTLLKSQVRTYTTCITREVLSSLTRKNWANCEKLTLSSGPTQWWCKVFRERLMMKSRFRMKNCTKIFKSRILWWGMILICIILLIMQLANL